MITVYIWLPTDTTFGHASMKITREGSTKYYSWWPAGGDVNVFRPRGRAAKSSAGYMHPRKNPVSYGDSHLDGTAAARADGKIARKIEGGDHNPGGCYVYNKSDKSQEDGSADLKFYFRPSSGLNAQSATNKWDRRLNKSKGEGAYHLFNKSCASTVLEALSAAAAGLPVPPPKLFGSDPGNVRLYCLELAKYLNENLPVDAVGLPPVIQGSEKGNPDRFTNPLDDAVMVFPPMLRHEAHP